MKGIAKIGTPIVLVLALVLSGILGVMAGTGYASPGATTRVSVASDGSQANEASSSASISGDGRFVAFVSWASNLVPGDTNGVWDIFVHDRQMGETTRVSVASDGSQANGRSHWHSISGDGRFVAFDSGASNLVPDDTNGVWDIFVHDRQTGETTRVSVTSDGTQAYNSNHMPSISADGGFIAFVSWASNLVPGDTNDCPDIFVHDRQTGETSRVSIASDGSQANSASSRWPRISGDGRFVAFVSWASNLVPGDTNNMLDVFVHDRQTGETSRVSVASDGEQGNEGSVNPSISGDGRFVAFGSVASNLVPGDTNAVRDIFVHDRQTGETSRVSVASDGEQGNDTSQIPSISADGRFVTFGSGASNLVPGDTNGRWDVFVHDHQTGETSRVSVASDGSQANHHSDWSSISADGRFVAFDSYASNLVLDDTNGVRDVFVHDRLAPVGPRNPPVADANGPYTGDEGSAITFDGTASYDSNGTIVSYEWDLDGDGEYDDATGATASHTWGDDYSGTIGLRVTDDDGATGTHNTTVTVLNVAPTVGPITAPVDPVAVNTEISASADFTDPGVLDTHTAEWDWGDGSITIVYPPISPVAASHTYTAAGVYTVTLTVTDDDGASGSSVFEYVVVYDPDAGFVTGGGWIYSEAGADLMNPSAEGKAAFGFTSKYKKGATEPTGQTEFQFKAGDLNFHSNEYEWLVVNQSGTNAQFKGTGTINGTGEYKFMLWAGDDDPDTFRIKIWEEDENGTETVRYDNGFDQPIGGGSIVIHTK